MMTRRHILAATGGLAALAAGGAAAQSSVVPARAGSGETDTGYRRVGSLAVPSDPDEIAAIKRRVLARRTEAPEIGAVARLRPEEARALFPPLRDGMPALHIEGAAAGRGPVAIRGQAALAIEGGRVVGVRVGDATVRADEVLVAAGAWAPLLLRPAGIGLPVEPQRGQILHLGLSGVGTSRWPALLPFNSYYLLAFDDSRVVVGATRETRSGFDHRLTAGGVAEVLRAGLALAPGLGGATVLEMRVGFRPMSPDGVPLLGRHPGLRGLVIGNGLGPNGLTMGSYCGRLLAELIVGPRPEDDLAAYRVDRRLGGQGV